MLTKITPDEVQFLKILLVALNKFDNYEKESVLFIHSSESKCDFMQSYKRFY